MLSAASTNSTHSSMDQIPLAACALLPLPPPPPLPAKRSGVTPYAPAAAELGSSGLPACSATLAFIASPYYLALCQGGGQTCSAVLTIWLPACTNCRHAYHAAPPGDICFLPLAPAWARGAPRLQSHARAALEGQASSSHPNPPPRRTIT